MTMKIDKYEHIGVDKYRIYLDNGEIIDTYDNVILKNDLLIKKEIDNDLYQKITTDTNIEEHYLACQKYITYRLRSTKEIKDYLIKKNIDSTTIDLIIDKLIQNKYLNDDYYCKCFINDKLKFTNMGSYQIINELKRKDIEQNIITKYHYLLANDIMNERIKHLIEKARDIAKVIGRDL